MAESLLDTLLAAETAVWDALKAGDAAADRAALADDFLGVTPNGLGGAGDHAANLEGGPAVSRYRLREVRAAPLGAGHGLLTYRADYVRPGRETEESMYVASIWRRDADRWLNIFSQDTPITGQIVP